MQSAPQSILVIEDDPTVREGLVDLFTFNGYRVESASDGESGLALALSGSFALAVVDVNLPGRDGFWVCNSIRQRDLEMAVIALTARSTDEDICRGFTVGVDDYVTKPFSVHELVLRVQAILRRTKRVEAERPFRLGDFMSISPNELNGSRLGDSSIVPFTRREMEILKLLRRSKSPVSRDDLLTSVWGYREGSFVETRTVDIHVVKLRKKIEPSPETPRFLLTVRGEGYQLVGVQE